MAVALISFSGESNGRVLRRFTVAHPGEAPDGNIRPAVSS